MTIEKAIEVVEEEAMDLLIKSTHCGCVGSECEDYDKCIRKLDDLNDIAKYLRDLKKIREIFVK